MRATQRVQITFRERFSRISRSLIDPRESQQLFQEIGVNPDRVGAIFVLYLVSVAYGVRLSALVIKIADTSFHDLHFWFFPIAPWFLGIALFPLALFGWLVSGIIVWIGAKTLGGKAGLRDTLGIVGYALGSLITASLIIGILITILGPNIGTVTTETWRGFTLFDLLFLPFIALAAYHCGNGLKTAHLLSDLYAYGISAVVALFYSVFYLLPIFF